MRNILWPFDNILCVNVVILCDLSVIFLSLLIRNDMEKGNETRRKSSSTIHPPFPFVVVLFFFLSFPRCHLNRPVIYRRLRHSSLVTPISVKAKTKIRDINQHRVE